MSKRSREAVEVAGEVTGEPSGSKKKVQKRDSTSVNDARPERVFRILSSDLNAKPGQVKSAVALLDDGNTVPFVARYRKEATGGLTDTQLRTLQTRLHSLDVLEDKRKTIFRKLEEQGVLSKELAQKIERAETLAVLEDLYLPFKPKKGTKASAAREKGLEGLAQALLSGSYSSKTAAKFVGKNGVQSETHAIEGAQHIIVELASEVPRCRELAREAVRMRGVMVVKATKLATGEQEKGDKEGKKKVAPKKAKGGGKGPSLTASASDPNTYQPYFEFSCPVQRLRAHQILAINRGESLGFLAVKIDWEFSHITQQCCKQLTRNRLPPECEKIVKKSIEEGVKLRIKPAAEREIRSSLREGAVKEASEAFSKNLSSLLLGAPLPGAVVMGIDPGFRTGCKIAVCDSEGGVLATAVMYPHPPSPQKTQQQAGPILSNLVEKHKVEAIAIGNGTASRETEDFVSKTLAGGPKNVGWCVVSECGASIYSASELAAKEFPKMDVTLRGAVSIARRLQDPLAEYVKVDPHHLGVGLYQHDIKAGLLAEQLKGVVESVVNTVGVEINTASVSLLGYVAGLTPLVASRIVQHREASGPFTNRAEIKKIKGLGPKGFTQAAGFLRIRNGVNALDNTPVHPESYPVALRLLNVLTQQKSDMATKECLTGAKGVLEEVGKGASGKWSVGALSKELDVGEPTLQDIIDALQAPGRDVRGKVPPSVLRTEQAGSLDDLQVGAEMQGVVRNVVEFGAFVDVNVGRDGLIHSSELSRFRGQRCRPHDVVGVGDRLRVRVKEVDKNRKRLGLGLVKIVSGTVVKI